MEEDRVSIAELQQDLLKAIQRIVRSRPNANEAEAIEKLANAYLALTGYRL
jgi:hypothetical protein